ncbi:flagella basal body P-ring formation protein FlgA [Paenarthrobacter nicotinovorans]|uniref:flagella basal body P-ring formation protein FlgA n=1 Tax=Paenarthrobacter nicotinovorans TaxID=29320 RepID=UPI00047E2E0F|nr:flagella basal body P-ring formation protein FlgA [Paenarthrobacter nicotinovorans]
MGQGAVVAAARLKKPSWKDPRLLIGILLVLVSVAGVIALVGSADRTTQVYTAREEIAVGQAVTMADLSIANVRLDDLESGYVTVEGGWADGRVALQRVAKNQLLAKESLGQADALNRKPVAVSVEGELPVQVVGGARVDVWVALPGSNSAFDEPHLLLPSAEIAQVVSGPVGLGASKTTQILVLVTDEQMPKLLGAQANKASISVVWNPAGLNP